MLKSLYGTWITPWITPFQGMFSGTPASGTSTSTTSTIPLVPTISVPQTSGSPTTQNFYFNAANPATQAQKVVQSSISVFAQHLFFNPPWFIAYPLWMASYGFVSRIVEGIPFGRELKEGVISEFRNDLGHGVNETTRAIVDILGDGLLTGITSAGNKLYDKLTSPLNLGNVHDLVFKKPQNNSLGLYPYLENWWQKVPVTPIKQLENIASMPEQIEISPVNQRILIAALASAAIAYVIFTSSGIRSTLSKTASSYYKAMGDLFRPNPPTVNTPAPYKVIVVNEDGSLKFDFPKKPS